MPSGVNLFRKERQGKPTQVGAFKLPTFALVTFLLLQMRILHMVVLHLTQIELKTRSPSEEMWTLFIKPHRLFKLSNKSEAKIDDPICIINYRLSEV
jgi:hypothetical protein